MERFSKREVQQVQTKNNSDSVEPCTVTNANNFNSRSYNVTNSDSSSTKNSNSSGSRREKAFWQYIKL